MQTASLLPFLGSVFGAALSSAATIAAAVWFWRIQARGKRQAEIAEAAFVGFHEALDAIEWCRMEARRFDVIGDGPPSDISEAWGETGREFRLVLWRLQANAPLFATLRKHQLLCEAHFGRQASEPFEQLSRTLTELKRAALTGLHLAQQAAQRATDGTSQALAEELSSVANRLFGTESDPVGARLRETRKQLETALLHALR